MVSLIVRLETITNLEPANRADMHRLNNIIKTRDLLRSLFLDMEAPLLKEIIYMAK